MFNFALGCLLTYFFQMCSACQVIQTALSDEFVFNIYRFITLCATGSFSPQEPLDLLHLGKCWDLVLIPKKWHEEEPHLWVTSSWDLPGFNSFARCLGLYGLCPHYPTARLTSADCGLHHLAQDWCWALTYCCLRSPFWTFLLPSRLEVNPLIRINLICFSPYLESCCLLFPRFGGKVRRPLFPGPPCAFHIALLIFSSNARFSNLSMALQWWKPLQKSREDWELAIESLGCSRRL